MPGYLSVVTGVDVTSDSRERGHAWTVARDTGLFVLGFSAVFVLLGLSATTVGSILFDNQLWLTRVSGVLVILMGIYVLSSQLATSPTLFQEARFHPNLSALGRAAPSVAGAAFGFGWTPCIGPVLGSILAIAATSDSALTGGSLLAVYSAGLGIPFLAAGMAYSRLRPFFERVKRRLDLLSIVSGITLIALGFLLVFNRLLWITSQMQDFLRSIGLDWVVELG